MILLAKQPKHILPERVETRTTTMFVGGESNPFLYAMIQVGMSEIMVAWEQKTYGRPEMFAVVHGPNTSALWLHPVPDKDYEARFRYCPALKEI